MTYSHTHQSHFLLRHIRQAFSKHATEYDTHAQLQQAVLFQAYRLLEPHLQMNDVLLDIGCGTGYLMEWMKNTDLPMRVVGMDIALGMCRIAREREVSPHYFSVVCGDIRALPFGNETADALLSSLALQWVAETEAAFREIHRVLQPGGRAVLTTFGPSTLQELRDAFAGVDEFPHVSPFVASDALEVELQNIGFNILKHNIEFRVENYEDVRELLAAIRAIGASNKVEGRRQSLTGKSRFAAMERQYHDLYGTARGIPATWEVMYFLVEKAA